MKIGIDIGNVIIGGGGEDTFFTEEYLWTPEVPGAYDSIDKIVYGDKTIVPDPDSGIGTYKIANEVHFISKCGKTTEERTMEWLYENKYYYLIDNQCVHFVRKRPLKAPMAQALELDIFIDDRQDVLDHMVDVVPNLILFTSWEQTNERLIELGAIPEG